MDSNHRPNGYASHYSFRCPFRVRGLDYLFAHGGRLPYSLYTFPGYGFGSGLPYLVHPEQT